MCQRRSEKTLHVGRTSPVKAIAPTGEPERIVLQPGPLLGRNHIRVAREKDPSRALGPEADQQVGFGPPVIQGSTAPTSVGRDERFDPVNQGKVGFP